MAMLNNQRVTCICPSMSIYVHLWTCMKIYQRMCEHVMSPSSIQIFVWRRFQPQTSPAWCSLKLLSETHPRNGSNWWLVGDLFHERWSDWSQNGPSDVPKRPLEGQQIKERLRLACLAMENAAAFGLFCQLASGKSKVAMENPLENGYASRFRRAHLLYIMYARLSIF